MERKPEASLASNQNGVAAARMINERSEPTTMRGSQAAQPVPLPHSPQPESGNPTEAELTPSITSDTARHILCDILENIEDGYYEVNLAGHYTFFNEPFCEILGYSRDELSGTSYPNAQISTRSLGPDEKETSRRVFDVFNQVYRTGAPVKDFSFEITQKDGSRRFVESSISLIRDAEGHRQGFRGIVRDITSRKKTEEALVQTEQKYRALIQNSLYGIYRVSVDGRLSEANPVLLKMLQYDSAAELAALNLATDVFRDPSDRERMVELYRKNGQIKNMEVDWKRKNGSIVTVQLSGWAARDDSGTLVGFDVLVEDVTERRTLEKQLRQSQKMEAVGRLAGGIAHDFNNLLTTIIGYSDLLLDKVGNASFRIDIEEIKKAGERAGTLTRQLLAFSRRQLLQPKVLNLDAVVADLSRMLRRLIGEDIVLITVPNRSLRCVRADPGQIEQVLMNLAVNARDAMPQGGRLVIETADVDLDESSFSNVAVQPGPYCMLSVSDTGVGMDEETQSRIFEPFFTTKEMGKGTGLGLATVYGIVKQSDGFVWVSSEPDKGTTFKIYLPQVQGLDSCESVEKSKLPSDGSETIMIVEDEDGVRALASRVLQLKGYSVLEVTPRRRSPVDHQETQCPHPLVTHRCGHAPYGRAGTGRTDDALESSDEGPLHVRLHERCHRPLRRPRPTDIVRPETIHSRDPDGKSAKSPRRPHAQ